MARIVCVANQKGGVGKTTTAVNLAVGLAKAGRETLLVDLDPQCNATTSFGKTPAKRHPLVLRQPLRESLRETATKGLTLLPGSRSFQDADTLEQGEADAIRSHLSGGVNAYDFVFIDCPPSLGRLTEAALTASTEVLMPIQCEYFA
ncbi:MAG TPA: AAA family ATPase, partial [Pirellulaceae bacterium]|nr:AAA family ATPase [Pirellulaceae bacterium]